MENYDFRGWATKNDLLCSDGRTIRKDAFKHNDGQTVPLVWMHMHNDPENVLGHAVLENKNEGVYMYGFFNESETGQTAKLLVEHGDITDISIFANQLKQLGNDVLHGAIKEVSLVLAGANPGAHIETVIQHGEECEDAAVIRTGEHITLSHADEEVPAKEKEPSDKPKEETEETVGDVFASMTEKQKAVVYAMVGQALEEKQAVTAEHSDINEGGTNEMKHNVFDTETQATATTLSHSDMESIISDAKRSGSLKDAFLARGYDEDTLAHTVTDDSGNEVTYGIANIDYLFPDARNVHSIPDLITRDMGWVSKVMNGARHLPFSRVKSIHANITMDEMRAKGYVKAGEKEDTVYSLLKRTTNPTTIYHKTKLDRDDIIDIVDFDVVAWIKSNERMMLDEEIARAALIGDGRAAGADGKISEDCIRPIWKDVATYVVRKPVVTAAGATDDDKAKAFIRAAVKARKDYKGSGSPDLFTTEDILTDCLLLEDGNGRVIYETVDKLCNALRVRSIVTVPVMENLTREGTGTDAGYNFGLMAIIVNMADYGFGADKGGAVNMFDDFDIDFNQQKYLIETRCSGALMKPYSAIVVELKTAASAG